MALPSRSMTTLLTAVLATGWGLVTPGPAVAVPVTASTVLAELVTTAEITAPAYDRDLFKHWVDADGDTCDTRSEVLQRSSEVAVTFSSGCTVATGQWTSAYDGVNRPGFSGGSVVPR